MGPKTTFGPIFNPTRATEKSGILEDMTNEKLATCNRRLFLLGTATTFAGLLATACGSKSATVGIADIPVGSAVIVDSFIIAQPTAGEYKAYSTVCPHANNPITKIEADTATCTKHNSVFSLADGSVISGPAPKGMIEFTTEVDSAAGTVSVTG